MIIKLQDNSSNSQRSHPFRYAHSSAPGYLEVPRGLGINSNCPVIQSTEFSVAAHDLGSGVRDKIQDAYIKRGAGYGFL